VSSESIYKLAGLILLVLTHNLLNDLLNLCIRHCHVAVSLGVIWCGNSMHYLLNKASKDLLVEWVP